MEKKTISARLVLSVLMIGAAAQASEPTQQPHKNKTVAQVAGAALHITQDVQTLQRQALRQHQGSIGPSSPQVQADRKALRRTRQKIKYLKRVKRRSEGR